LTGHLKSLSRKMNKQNLAHILKLPGIGSFLFYLLISLTAHANNNDVENMNDKKDLIILAYHLQKPSAVNQNAFLFMKLEELKIKKKRSEDRRFIDNQDGTITDTVMELIWTKTDSFDNLRKCLNYNNSKDYVKKLRTGGYEDWKIPTTAELKSLYDERKWNKDYSGGTIHIDPIFPPTGAWRFWASEKAGSCCAIRVSMANGFTAKNLRSYCGDDGVRAVRSTKKQKVSEGKMKKKAIPEKRMKNPFMRF